MKRKETIIITGAHRGQDDQHTLTCTTRYEEWSSAFHLFITHITFTIFACSYFCCYFLRINRMQRCRIQIYYTLRSLYLYLDRYGMLSARLTQNREQSWWEDRGFSQIHSNNNFAGSEKHINCGNLGEWENDWIIIGCLPQRFYVRQPRIVFTLMSDEIMPTECFDSIDFFGHGKNSQWGKAFSLHSLGQTIWRFVENRFG